MPGISIITNFDVNQSVPIDSRLVATNATARQAIFYLYEGLKVYQTDVKKTYTWNGTTWDVEGSGIYGGSGSLLDDTYVNFGTVSSTINSESKELGFLGHTTGDSKVYLTNYFLRHTTVPLPGFEFRGIEYRQQFKYFEPATSNVINGAYISFNPILGGTDNLAGGLAFSTGFSNNLREKMRITAGGRVGIATNDPKEFLQIGTSSATTSPLVFHNSGSAVIGYNWWFSGTQQFFDVSKPSTKLVQSNGTFEVQNRIAGAGASDYSTTIFTTGLSSGRVGIRTNTPSVALDVVGDIKSNSLIEGQIVTAGTVSSSNKVLARRVDFTSLSNTYITTAQSTSASPTDTLIFSVGNTQSITTNGSTNKLIDTFITGKLDVVRDLTVYGTSSITNFEPSTLLTPSSIVYYSNNSGDFTNTTTISNFTYSISAYRVGALVNLTFEFDQINNAIPYTDANFFGFMFRLSHPKFVPAESSYGSGFGGNTSIGVKFIPVITEVFQTDPTNGSATPLSSNDFWVRIRTTNIWINTTNYTGYPFKIGPILGIGNTAKFTMSYKAGDITSITTFPPTTPIPIVSSS